ELAAVVGTLFQDPETQVVLGTVRAELAFPLENRGLTPAAVARAVEEAALALGVAVLLDRATHELSGGVLQRVNEEWGTAVLLAEHRIERCLPAADRVLALEGGALAFDGTPEEFLRRSPETPIARLFALAGRSERPVSVKAARRALGAAPRDAADPVGAPAGPALAPA